MARFHRGTKNGVLVKMYLFGSKIPNCFVLGACMHGEILLLFAGFDLASDFDMLEVSVPCFGKAILNRKNMMDVKILGNRVETAFPDLLPFREGRWDGVQSSFTLGSDFELLFCSGTADCEVIQDKRLHILFRSPVFGPRRLSDSPELSRVFPVPPAPGSGSSPAGSAAAAARRKPKEVAKGLSELVRKCLGRPLDKAEQCSNWNRRPLRQTQLQYAGEPGRRLPDPSFCRRRLTDPRL